MTINKSPSRSSFFPGHYRVATACVFLLVMSIPKMGALAVPSPAAAKAPNPLHHIAGTIVRNPHLKGVDAPLARSGATVKKKASGEIVHRTIRRRWDYHSWIALHRGLGIIRGVVQAPSGGAMSSAKVWLKHPNGSVITVSSRRHTTYADAGGNFSMLGVRHGRYRVVAQVGKKKAHHITAVHPGTVAEVAIKL